MLNGFFCRGRVRTCVNVWGDCVGVGVIERLSHKELVASADPPEADDEDSAENTEMIEKEDKRDNLREDC